MKSAGEDPGVRAGCGKEGGGRGDAMYSVDLVVFWEISKLTVVRVCLGGPALAERSQSN